MVTEKATESREGTVNIERERVTWAGETMERFTETAALEELLMV